jgi:putative FmdB family regulatory protein
MPLYEYRCSSCGHQEEFLQKLSDAPRTVCTSCGKETFSKLLTAAGFQLKGSGWYATDFKTKDKKPAAKTDASKGESTGGDSSKSDSSKSESSGGDSSKGDGGAKKDAAASCGAGACAACS